LGESGGFGHAAGLDAAGAHDHLLGSSVHSGAHALQVRLETSFGNIMGMADVAAYHRFFSADFTYFSRRSVSACVKVGRLRRFVLNAKPIPYILLRKL
jgi:hypothetical protein